MIAYTMVGTNNLDASKAFYDAIFDEMGIKALWTDEKMVGYGPSMDQPMFSVCKPYNGEAATIGNGTMIALNCATPDMVEKVHKKALELGAANEGDAGPRGESGFYCGYFRDLDGNKLNAFAMGQPG